MAQEIAPKRKHLYYWLQILVSLVGAALSIYLLIQHTRLKNGIQGTDSFCSFGPFADCDVVSASSYSEVLGIPLASIGALYFFVLFILGLVAPIKDRNFATIQKLFARLTGFALVIDLGLLGIQIFKINSICLLCFTTYLATYFHLVLNKQMSEKKWGNLLRNDSPLRIKWSSAQKGLVTLGILLFGASLYFIPHYIKLEAEHYQNADASVEQFFANWKNLPKRKIKVKPTDLVSGNPEAYIQLVEYSDFQCPHCKNVSKIVHTLLNANGSKVHFIFKNYPLDSSCNSALVYAMHPQACKLARLAYCANSKGKFWDFHDFVFNENWDSAFQADKVSKFLTKQEYDVCLSDDHSLKMVQQDIDEGNQADIKGTPTIFINGKQVTIPLTIDNLQKLIRMEE